MVAPGAHLQAVLAGELYSPTRFTGPQTIWLADGRFTAIQPGATAHQAAAVLDARDGLVVPGLVDLQVNGGLGRSFQHTDQAHFHEITRYYLERGTTTFLPTLITAETNLLIESLAALSVLCGNSGRVSLPGIHLEGPFLSPAKSGAHDPTALRQPDAALLQRFIDAADGRIRMLTLAPELPGAGELIRLAANQGILVSAGHSAASYTQITAAVSSGLRFMTHLGNASDWPHRAPDPMGFLGSEPGFVGSFLAITELGGSVIMDGFHFHPALLKPLTNLKPPGGLVLISDASSVTGLPPGRYESGGLQAVIHPQGFATSARGGGWLAGSIISLLEAVQRSVNLAGLPLEQTLAMATLFPARWIGLEGIKGEIRPGADGDLLVLNHDLSLRHVVAGGFLVK